MANSTNTSSTKIPAVPATSTDYVRLINHHAASLGLPPIAKEAADKLNIKAVGNRILNPGENNVSAEHWNAVKDQSPVTEWMQAGLLEVGTSDTSKPEGPVEPSALSDLTPAKAVEYINTEKDPSKLVALSKDEKRPEVQQALQRRIESLGVPSK